MPGKVYLIGMGPGAADLVTIKAVEAIKSCDVLIYDRLVNKELLKYNACAEHIYVGKASGKHTLTQDEINELLVQKAIEGYNVARLKGGDPFVFGRGGEEAIKLGNYNIEYEIIPGITSAVAVPMYAGIPVTHRGIATSFHVITGHEYSDNPDINWKALANIKGTLIFLMGIENISLITEKLIAEGRGAECSAAVIMNGTRTNQKEVFGTLKDIALKCEEEQIKSPAIIMVGEVVALAASINRPSVKPLSGIRVLNTRPLEKSKELSSSLRSQGATVYDYPCINIKRINSLSLNTNQLQAYDAIVFSSSYGVRYFFENLKTNKIDIRSIRGKLYGVGMSVQSELEEHGLYDSIIPASYNSTELAEVLKSSLSMDSSILLICGDIGSEGLMEQLSAYAVEKLIVYSTIEGNERELDYEVDIIVFTSPSGVRGFAKVNDLGKYCFKPVVCIGESTKLQAQELGFQLILLPNNTGTELITKVIADWRHIHA